VTTAAEALDRIREAQAAIRKHDMLAFWIRRRYSSELPNTKPWALLLRRARDAAVGVGEARGPPTDR
jgi:hypothetical protein